MPFPAANGRARAARPRQGERRRYSLLPPSLPPRSQWAGPAGGALPARSASPRAEGGAGCEALGEGRALGAAVAVVGFWGGARLCRVRSSCGVPGPLSLLLGSAELVGVWLLRLCLAGQPQDETAAGGRGSAPCCPFSGGGPWEGAAVLFSASTKPKFYVCAAPHLLGKFLALCASEGFR